MSDELTLDLSKTYIHEGDEYILTGRYAEREQDAAAPKQRRSRRNKEPVSSNSELDYMVEIRPSQRGNIRPIGTSADNRWVRFGDLYAIMDILEEPEGEA